MYKCVYIYIYIYTHILHMCVYIYIYMSVYLPFRPMPRHGYSPCVERSVRTKFYGQSPYTHYGFQRVWLEHNLNSKGWNSQALREFPGKFDSSNVSRRNVSREIGRSLWLRSRLYFSGSASVSFARFPTDRAGHPTSDYCVMLVGRLGVRVWTRDLRPSNWDFAIWSMIYIYIYIMYIYI